MSAIGQLWQLVALGLSLMVASPAAAQCPGGERGCASFELELSPDPPDADPPDDDPPDEIQVLRPDERLGLDEPPPPPTAGPGVSHYPTGGFLVSMQLLFSPRATMAGGAATGFVALAPLLTLDAAVSTAARDELRAFNRETALVVGPRLVLTPESRLRISVPVRTGFAVHREERDGARDRFMLYTLSAGVAGHLQLRGPAYAGATVHGQLQVAPGRDEVTFATVMDIDLLLVF